MQILHKICTVPLFYRWLLNYYSPASQNLQALGLQFSNKVGLAAGFDKNAKYLKALHALGFSHIEIGTVTPRPQAGNPTPRLFRLVQDKALLNRMGFNNDGVELVAQKLQTYRQTNPKSTLVIGGNIGKNKETPNEYAYMDYDKCFRTLLPLVDYFTINVSSPNTPGLRELQEKDSLYTILTHLQAINQAANLPKPILLKIAPDLTFEQLDAVIDLSIEIKLDGLVVANTTIDRTKLSDAGKLISAEKGQGGLSGLPVKNMATEMIQYIHQKTNGNLFIIGVGGIFTAMDAQEKLNAGASMVQVWTGFVYEGPAIVKKIVKGLA